MYHTQDIKPNISFNNDTVEQVNPRVEVRTEMQYLDEDIGPKNKSEIKKERIIVVPEMNIDILVVDINIPVKVKHENAFRGIL